MVMPLILPQLGAKYALQEAAQVQAVLEAVAHQLGPKGLVRQDVAPLFHALGDRSIQRHLVPGRTESSPPVTTCIAIATTCLSKIESKLNVLQL